MRAWMQRWQAPLVQQGRPLARLQQGRSTVLLDLTSLLTVSQHRANSSCLLGRQLSGSRVRVAQCSAHLLLLALALPSQHQQLQHLAQQELLALMVAVVSAAVADRPRAHLGAASSGSKLQGAPQGRRRSRRSRQVWVLRVGLWWLCQASLQRRQWLERHSLKVQLLGGPAVSRLQHHVVAAGASSS